MTLCYNFEQKDNHGTNKFKGDIGRAKGLNSELITHPNITYDHDILNISQTRYTRQEQVVTLH